MLKQLNYKCSAIAQIRLSVLFITLFCYYQILRSGQHVCICVCGSVCPLAYLKNNMSKLHKIFYTYYLWPWLGLLWRQCKTLCTSGIVDDVMFSRNGPNTYIGLESATGEYTSRFAYFPSYTNAHLPSWSLEASFLSLSRILLPHFPVMHFRTLQFWSRILLSFVFHRCILDGLHFPFPYFQQGVQIQHFARAGRKWCVMRPREATYRGICRYYRSFEAIRTVVAISCSLSLWPFVD